MKNLKIHCLLGIVLIEFVGLSFSFLLPPLFYPNQTCPVVNEIDIFNFFQRNGTPSRWTRPVKDFTTSVGITFELAIRSIVQLDQKNQEIFIRGSIFMFWQDEYRIWNDTFPLNCVDTVTMPFGEETNIWTPNLFFSNS